VGGRARLAAVYGARLDASADQGVEVREWARHPSGGARAWRYRQRERRAGR
jgi:hypothetical protein